MDQEEENANGEEMVVLRSEISPDAMKFKQGPSHDGVVDSN